MNDSRYDQIAEWYGALRRDDAVSLVDNLVFPYIDDLLEREKIAYVCDLGCGQGKLARHMAERGVRVLGVDLSEKLLSAARDCERSAPLGIVYLRDNAETLSNLNSDEFDCVVCNMALMDIPDLVATFHAVHRILKSAGWFVFSITHPCFESPHAKWAEIGGGIPVRVIHEYLDDRFWMSRNPEGLRGRVGAYHRTISTYMNSLVGAGFCLSHVTEPRATKEETSWVPGFAVVPAFMSIEARKITALP